PATASAATSAAATTPRAPSRPASGRTSSSRSTWGNARTAGPEHATSGEDASGSGRWSAAEAPRGAGGCPVGDPRNRGAQEPHTRQTSQGAGPPRRDEGRDALRWSGPAARAGRIPHDPPRSSRYLEDSGADGGGHCWRLRKDRVSEQGADALLPLPARG